MVHAPCFAASHTQSIPDRDFAHAADTLLQRGARERPRFWCVKRVVIIDDERQTAIARHPAATIPLLGNRLCLDFTNTLVWRLRKQSSEFLGDYPALMAWSRYAGALGGGVADFGRVGAGPAL